MGWPARRRREDAELRTEKAEEADLTEANRDFMEINIGKIAPTPGSLRSFVCAVANRASTLT